MKRPELNDFLIAENTERLGQILRREDYRLFVRSLKASTGKYQFRVHDEDNSVIARSREFESREFESRDERDRLFDEFIRFVEVDLNGRLQISLF